MPDTFLSEVESFTQAVNLPAVACGQVESAVQSECFSEHSGTLILPFIELQESTFPVTDLQVKYFNMHQDLYKRICLFILLSLLMSISSCRSSQFIPGEFNMVYQKRDFNCELKFFTQFPDDSYTYDLIGTCIGKGRNGIIKSDYDNAHQVMEECACSNGANAIVLVNSREKGYYAPNDYMKPGGGIINFGSTYQKTSVEVIAYAIYL
jgi:hypothetical protein